MFGALVEWGSVRSHVNRDRPMGGSCLSSSSRASFRSSSSESLSACADSLRARVRPARPIRSNVSALGNTSRCAFISPVKRARMMRPSSVSNAARAAKSIAVPMSYPGTNVRRPRCPVASLRWLERVAPWSRSGPELETARRSARPAKRPGERAVRCRRANLGPDGAAVRCGSPARDDSPGVGAYRSNQGPHRAEGSCAPAKRCRKGSRVELRGPMPAPDVVKPFGLCCKPDERARWSGREMCPP